MCCTPVSLGTFLLLMVMVSGLGDVLIESIGDAVDGVFDSRPMRFAGRVIKTTVEVSAGVFAIIVVFVIIATGLRSSTAAAPLPQASPTAVAPADTQPADAPVSEPIAVATPDASAITEPDSVPLDISTLPLDTQPEPLPLDAHALSTSPIGLVESPPQARIPKPAHHWWRRE
jgi:hypothetical protein